MYSQVPFVNGQAPRLFRAMSHRQNLLPNVRQASLALGAWQGWCPLGWLDAVRAALWLMSAREGDAT